MMISDGRSGGGGTSGGGSPYHHHHHHQHQYQQAYQQHKHHHIHHLHHPPPPSPPSSPSSAASTTRCCSLKRSSCCRRRGRTSWCCCCYCPASSVFTSLGVCILVLGYTLLGAFVFMALEGGSMRDPTSQLAAATTASKSSVLGEDIRSRTVEKLWSITEDLNILYKDNWTRLAAQEVLKFQDTLVRNLRGYGGGGAVVKGGAGGSVGNGAAIYYSHHHHRWSFSSSFLYSLTLITTIGK